MRQPKPQPDGQRQKAESRSIPSDHSPSWKTTRPAPAAAASALQLDSSAHIVCRTFCEYHGAFCLLEPMLEAPA